MSVQEEKVPAATTTVVEKSIVEQIADEREQWRQEYLKGVTSRIGSIPYQTSINPSEGRDEDLAPPCFFYGTLMALPVLYRVIFQNPRPPAELTDNIYVRPAVLKDHKCQIVKHADYPGMVKHEGSTAYGTYVTGITKRGLRNLDRFEGSQYRLASIRVNVLIDRKVGPVSPEGKPTWTDEVWEERDAMTYIFIAGEDSLGPTAWTFENYMNKHMLYWAGITNHEGENYETTGYWKDATTITPIQFNPEKHAVPDSEPGWV
ncbi:hypothetical protein DFH27DRAFT_86654 [Peziza echinospora]|nr:hypothetical protein DFH27DRAFT_86654 [Peziza echinospora]